MAVMLTDAPCNVACWTAEEDSCRCSCGGANHGVLKGEGSGTIPQRTSKIDGVMYKLEAIGVKRWDIEKPCELINRDSKYGWREIIVSVYTNLDKSEYEFVSHRGWFRQDKGSPARMKTIELGKHRHWPELKRYKDLSDSWRVYLLWVRVTMPEPTYCPPEKKCEKCIDKKFTNFIRRAKEDEVGE